MIKMLFCVGLAATSVAHATDNNRFASTLPFRDCENLICIDAELGGAHKQTLLLDTGNGNSVVLTDVARTLGWKLDPIVQEGKALPGMFRTGEHNVELGGLNRATKFLALDRDQFGKQPIPGEGTLGYSFFKDRVLQIDYPRHVLRISDVLTDPVAASSAPATLSLITFGKQGPPIVVGAPFTLNGKTLHAQIDTFFTGTLLVYDASLDALKLRKHGKPTFFGFTDGGVNLLEASTTSIGFDKVDLGGKHPPMYFVGAGDNPVHQPDGLFEATVGNPLLAHSVVTLDFHAMTLKIEAAQ